MTKSPDFLPVQTGDRLVLFVAFPDMCLLDLSGPQTVFWVASRIMKNRGLAGYRCQTVNMTGGPVRAAEGVVLETRPVADFERAAIDTIMVSGSFSITDVLPESSALMDWPRRISASTRRMTSVCSGAFLLAQAGLLRGKRAATHWLMCDRLEICWKIRSVT